MSQLTIYLLLAGALILPVVGAVLLRMVSRWLNTPLLYGAAAIMVLGAAACALVLAGQPSEVLQIGGLVVIQPVGMEPDGALEIDDHGEEPAPEPSSTSVSPTAASTSTPSPSATTTATSRPSATAEPTETATSEPTATDTPEPTEEEEEEDEPTIYVVQSGDSMGSIARDFGVTVEAIMEANDMSAAEADSLQVGQELIIP